MELPDTQRHLGAGASAAIAFLTFFFPLHAAWYIALPAVLPVYGAILLLISRKPEEFEVKVSEGITQAELKEAIGLCDSSAERFRQFAETLKGDVMMPGIFRHLAELVVAIGSDYRDDPQDLRYSRGFTDYHLPQMVTAAERYVAIRAKPHLSEDAKVRLDGIVETFRNFEARVQAILEACQRNDVTELTTRTRALGQIMEQEIPITEQEKKS